MEEYYDDLPDFAASMPSISADQLPGVESGMDVRSIYLAEKHRLNTGETIKSDQFKNVPIKPV